MISTSTNFRSDSALVYPVFMPVWYCWLKRGVELHKDSNICIIQTLPELVLLLCRSGSPTQTEVFYQGLSIWWDRKFDWRTLLEPFFKDVFEPSHWKHCFYSLLVQQKKFTKSKRNHLDRAFPMSDIAACTLLCVGSIEMFKLRLGPFRSCPLEFHGAAWKWSCPFLFPDRWWRRGLGLCGAGEQTLPHPGCGPQWASSCSWDEGGFSKWDDFPGEVVLLSKGLGLPVSGEGEVLLFPVLSAFVSVSGICAQWVLLPFNPLLFLSFCPWDSWSLFFTRLNYPFQVAFLTFSLFEVGVYSHGWLVLVVVVFCFFDWFFYFCGFFKRYTILASLFTLQFMWLLVCSFWTLPV